jgi:hypothetical protein
LLSVRPLALTLVVVPVLALTGCGDNAPPARVASAPAPSATLVAVEPVDAGPEIDSAAAAPSAEVSDAGPDDAAPHALACAHQDVQPFLVRGNYIPKPNASAADRKLAAETHAQAVRYRTEQYGYHPGFGRSEWNAHAPPFYVRDTTFMGLPVKMHEKVIPALQCVEAAIKLECTDKPYKPRALAGIRYKNTYRGFEVTNHIYGIAIDLDPGGNPCCGCVKPWSEAPVCTKRVKSEFERMVMPECWVKVFEEYGFYWLGHDVLKDTMHFEFLGDPDKIMQ